MPDLSVVLPTYNEADHVQDLLHQVATACQGIDYEIVVVDDNSPDGTHGKVLEASRSNPRVVPVLRAKERGLATAVIEGIRRSTGTYVVVMDSDFQHPPETVPKLLEAAQRANADVVVASRYAPGGTVTDFPLMRRIISWGAKTLSVVALGRVRHFHITDPMSGFFLVRRAAVDPDRLDPIGYKILIEVLARGNIERAVEVGFRFQSRRAGESKLRLSTQWDYFRHVLGLAFHDAENRRIFRFGLVGTTGIVVFFAVYLGLKQAFQIEVPSQVSFQAADLIHRDAPFLLANAVGREVSIVWNFGWNEAITFHDLREHAHAGFFQRVLRFNATSVGSWLAFLAIGWGLVKLGVGDVPSNLVAILLTFVLNYRGNRRWTYARRQGAPHA